MQEDVIKAGTVHEPPRGKEQGYVLIMVMVFTTIMLIMGMALLYLGQVERSLTMRAIHSGQALQLAEAGIERAIWELRRHPDWRTMPPDSLYTNVLLGAGSYNVVLGPRSRHRITITSTARVGDQTRAIQVDLVDRVETSGFWKFDEGGGTMAYDSTRNENHGEIEGDPVWIPGWKGLALRFGADTVEYVVIPSHPTLTPAHGITLDHWFRTTYVQNSTWIMVKGWDPFYYGTYLTSNSRRIYFCVQLRTRGVRSVSFTLPGVGFADGLWHRITGTFDGRFLKIYHNGVLRGTTDIGTEDIIAFDDDTDDPLYFASYRDGDIHFHGDLDEVSITAITPPSPLAVRDNVGIERWREVPTR